MQNLFARDLSIESELFLAVCRASVPSTRVQSWVERSEGIAVDWELVLRMAAKHRVMPLLHRQVQAQLRDRVPKSWYRRLENRVAANSERCERLASQLVQAQWFTGVGVWATTELVGRKRNANAPAIREGS